EKEEVRDIYRAKGFEGELLEQVVAVITADKDRWVDTMMKEELEMIPERKSPFKIGGVTFLSFLVIGLIPLLAYLFKGEDASMESLFLLSCLMTGVAFIMIGWLKAYVTQTSRWRAILETVLLGASAAALAYIVGDWLEKIVAG
ncbi:MAG: VIT1/CCC1 transporter family protein, partial [Bacteroidia bacterium]|nr:VIT1/CCC1 transporter family protein [Bacteroidia bacterium]